MVTSSAEKRRCQQSRRRDAGAAWRPSQADAAAALSPAPLPPLLSTGRKRPPCAAQGPEEAGGCFSSEVLCSASCGHKYRVHQRGFGGLGASSSVP